MKKLVLLRKLIAALLMIVLFALVIGGLLQGNGWFSFQQVMLMVIVYTGLAVLLFGLVFSYGIDYVKTKLHDHNVPTGWLLLLTILLYGAAGAAGSVLVTFILMGVTGSVGMLDSWMLGVRLSPFGMAASLMFAAIEYILKRVGMRRKK